MLNVPEEVKALCKSDGVRKNFRVEFLNNDLPDLTNEDIVTESVSFTESLCSRDRLKFGVCEASTISFEAVNIPNIKGEEIKCGIEIDCSSLDVLPEGVEIREGLEYPIYYIPYGVFKIESCKRNADTNRREVQAYSYENVVDYGVPASINALYWYTNKDAATLGFTADNLLDLTFPSYSVARHPLERGYVDDYPSNTLDLGDGYTLSLHCSMTVMAYQNTKTICTYRAVYDRNRHKQMVSEATKKIRDRFDVDVTEFLREFKCDYETVDNAYGVLTYDAKGNPATLVAGNWYSLTLKSIHAVSASIIFDSLPHSVFKIYDYKQGSTARQFYISGCYCDPVYNNPPTLTYGGVIRVPNCIRLLKGTEIVEEWNSQNYVESYLEEIGDGEIVFSIAPNEQLRNIFTYNYATKKTISSGYRVDYMYNNAIAKLDDNKWRNLIESCLELKGCMGHFNRQGTFELKKIEIPNNIYPRDYLFPSASTFPKEVGGEIINTALYSSAWFDDYPTKPLRAVSATYNAGDRKGYAEYNIPIIMDIDEIVASGSLAVNEPSWVGVTIWQFYNVFSDALLPQPYTFPDSFDGIIIESNVKIIGVQFLTSMYELDYFEMFDEPSNRVIVNDQEFLKRMTNLGLPIIALDVDTSKYPVDISIYTHKKDGYFIDTEDVSVYDMSDNYFLSTEVCTQERAEEILSKVAPNIEGVQYTPSNVNCIGLPYIEAGDWVTIIAEKDGFDSLILSRTLSGVQSLKDSYESKGE